MNTFPCPVCGEPLPAKSRFCNMCGCNIQTEMNRLEEQRRLGMIPMIEKQLNTADGIKRIQVLCKDITALTEPIDLLTVSAYSYSYQPTERSVIGALYRNKGISVKGLAAQSFIDLRRQANCWLSEELQPNACNQNIRRIGCIEAGSNGQGRINSQVLGIRSYFHMLNIAADVNIKLDSIVIPVLGTGDQGMTTEMVAVPMLNEAVKALKTNPAIKKITFVERNYEKACKLRAAVQGSLQLFEDQTAKHPMQQPAGGGAKPDPGKPYVFISYCVSSDQEIGEAMYQELTARKIPCWFAAHSLVSGDYAREIVDAINKSTHFICIVSKGSMKSQHVLNELDLAFAHVKDGLTLLPFRMDQEELDDSFKYYLSRQQWNYGTPPPAIARIKEFIDKIFVR